MLSFAASCSEPALGDAPDQREPDWAGDFDECAGFDVRAGGGASYDSIGAAIADAPKNCTIRIYAGTYTENLTVEGKPLRLKGADPETTIIDGGGADRVLLVREVGEAGVALEGLTLRNGEAFTGAGIRSVRSRLRMNDVIVENNQGGEHGGGVRLFGSMSEITNSQFRGNRAIRGGAIAATGGKLVIRNSSFSDNSAELQGGALWLSNDAKIEGNQILDNRSGWTGGGIYVDRHEPTIESNELRRNSASDDGGAIYLHQSKGELRNNLVADNHAGDDGGGIRVFESKARLIENGVEGNHAEDGGGGIKISHLPCEVVDNRITGNTAGGSGGGLELDNDSSVVRGGLVAHNHAPRGAGIYLYQWPWNGGRIEGVRIEDNEAGRGGGIYVEDNFRPVDLRNLSVVGNRAQRGAGVSVRTSHVTISNALLAGNISATGGGGLEIGGTGDYTDPAWAEPCPCPPEQATGTVRFSVIHDNRAEAGSGLWIDSPDFEVSSSIVADNPGPQVTSIATVPRWLYNDTAPARFTGMPDPTNEYGNISSDPMFADPTAQDFTLLIGSPCQDAGDPALTDPDGTRADMGLFGGPHAP